MATSFSRTLRSLKSDKPTRHVLAIGVALVILLSWSAWMVFARVAVYEASPAARLEVEQAAHAVQSPVAGRVIKSDMPLGRQVEVGDVLCELEVDAQRLELEQARARLVAIGPELDAARKEFAANQQAAVDDGQGVDATVAEARAKHDEALVAEKLAEQQLTRAQRLEAEGLMSASDLERARADLAEKRASSEANRLAIGRIGASGRADLSDRLAKRESLGREIAILEGEALTQKALIERLQNEVDRRIVRASVAGRVAEVGTFTAGSVVKEGDRLGAIVPSGQLRIIAEFPPPRAMGRIQVGQPARMRLDGFPWAQHGMVPARVAHVATEVRAGRIRVELDVMPNDLGVPLQHGLPGSLEVEVERTAPIILLMRAAGKLLDDPPAPTAAPAPESSGVSTGDRESP